VLSRRAARALASWPLRNGIASVTEPIYHSSHDRNERGALLHRVSMLGNELCRSGLPRIRQLKTPTEEE
jgi:hypothetical protein